MAELIYPKLSYMITGLCFQVHNDIGYFGRERQYADALEELFKTEGVKYKREYELINLQPESPKGNRVDFLVEDKIILELKASKRITKEDYYQTKRYLEAAKLRLGLIINFRNRHLKPQRVINACDKDIRMSRGIVEQKKSDRVEETTVRFTIHCES